MFDEEVAGLSRCSQQEQEFVALRQFSARIGSDPFLVQASTGNASIKIDGNLWIKASGRWLADAQTHQIFVPMQLAVVRNLFVRGEEIPDASDCATGKTLQPSIETPMHAVLPHRVVIHVHSISTIAWAVLLDGQSRLEDLLAGLRWRWIRYVDSGIALAREIEAAISRSPDANVFVLANHGLVVCGSDCRTADRLLAEVEERLAAQPRSIPSPDLRKLRNLAQGSEWELPDDCTLHAFGSDPVSRRILDDGVLFPCQATFFSARLRPFLIVEGCGVLTARGMSRADRAMLTGLVQIILRIPGKGRIRYLAETELQRISTTESGHYRESAEKVTNLSLNRGS